MSKRFTVVGIGEALFDIFPDASRLGGAPLNVAVHAHQLGQPQTVQGVVVSRIGQDELGQQLLQSLQKRDIDTGFIESDPDRPTGTVYISQDAQGSPIYDITQNAAWDWLQYDTELDALARRTAAVCFGTLAQRSAETRNAIHRFLAGCPQALKLLDVNLRTTTFDDELHHILDRSLTQANALKLSDEELPEIARLLHLRADIGEVPAKLIETYQLDFIALTRGAQGTRLITADETVDGQPADFNPLPDATPVGAGDSVAAAVILGRLLNHPLQQIADHANRVGAYVAGQPGATPELPDDLKP